MKKRASLFILYIHGDNSENYQIKIMKILIMKYLHYNGNDKDKNIYINNIKTVLVSCSLSFLPWRNRILHYQTLGYRGKLLLFQLGLKGLFTFQKQIFIKI